jgi:hypothetical protein
VGRGSRFVVTVSVKGGSRSESSGQERGKASQ